MGFMTLTVTIDDAEHETLHKILVAFGFSFQVNTVGQVGRFYHHPYKNLDAELLAVGDEWFATLYDRSRSEGERTVTDEHFTPKEVAWIEAADTEAEYLSRELHILIQVRPSTFAANP